MAQLQRIAGDAGAAVICTIHQPRSAIWEMLDRVRGLRGLAWLLIPRAETLHRRRQCYSVVGSMPDGVLCIWVWTCLTFPRRACELPALRCCPCQCTVIHIAVCRHEGVIFSPPMIAM
jgi:hypothetical protein